MKKERIKFFIFIIFLFIILDIINPLIFYTVGGHIVCNKGNCSFYITFFTQKDNQTDFVINNDSIISCKEISTNKYHLFVETDIDKGEIRKNFCRKDCNEYKSVLEKSIKNKKTSFNYNSKKDLTYLISLLLSMPIPIILLFLLLKKRKNIEHH